MSLGWHFVGDTLRDGSPIPPDGEWLEHHGEIMMCRSGLHYSRRLIDALVYAPGSTVCRVEVCGGWYEKGKGVASARRIIWRLEAENILRRFACRCALDVIHLWDAPEIVVQYLRTGDEKIRVAAGDAARDAARVATGDAAWVAARAAGAAARDAARVAAWVAAWAAARDARDAAGARQNRRLTSMVMRERGGA